MIRTANFKETAGYKEVKKLAGKMTTDYDIGPDWQELITQDQYFPTPSGMLLPRDMVEGLVPGWTAGALRVVTDPPYSPRRYFANRLQLILTNPDPVEVSRKVFGIFPGHRPEDVDKLVAFPERFDPSQMSYIESWGGFFARDGDIVTTSPGFPKRTLPPGFEDSWLDSVWIRRFAAVTTPGWNMIEPDILMGKGRDQVAKIPLKGRLFMDLRFNPQLENPYSGPVQTMSVAEVQDNRGVYLEDHPAVGAGLSVASYILDVLLFEATRRLIGRLVFGDK